MPKFKVGDIIKYSPENNKKYPGDIPYRYRVIALDVDCYRVSHSYDLGKTWIEESFVAGMSYHDKECILDDPLKSFVQNKLLTMGIRIL